MGMNEIIDALAKQAALEDERLHRQKMDAVVQFASTLFDKAAAYENVIVLGGYVAFFSVWATVSHQLTKNAALLCGGLMAISLTLYVGWHILQMLTRLRHHPKFGQLVSADLPPREFLEKWQAAELAQQRESVMLLRVWPWFFLPTLVTGITASVILSYNCFAEIAGLPILL
jgi:hypothetical protein